MPEITLTQNELLVDITRKLEGVHPNWEEVVRRFIDSITYDGETRYDRNLYFRDGNQDQNKRSSNLAQIHLRVTLEQICGQFVDRVVFNPIGSNQSTEHYTFEVWQDKDLKGSRDVIKISSKETNQRLYELDGVVVIDELPVIFETRLANYKGKGNKNNPSHRGISYLMSHNRIGELLLPLGEFFETPNIGYVLIIDPQQISPKSPHQWDFKRRGGLLVPFYTDRENYGKGARKIAQQYFTLPVP